MQVVVEDSDKLVSVEEPSFFDEAAGLLWIKPTQSI
jgi:hypothetical protein